MFLIGWQETASQSEAMLENTNLLNVDDGVSVTIEIAGSSKGSWILRHQTWLQSMHKNVIAILGLVPEAGISGLDRLLHHPEYCGMQLLIPVGDTSNWHSSPHLKIQEWEKTCQTEDALKRK